MRHIYTFLFFLYGVLCQAQELREEVFSFEEAYKRKYTITKITNNRAFQIDGKLDEEIWQNEGEWSEKFSQVIPYERVFTASWTRMKIFYDDENIYVGVYCKDENPERMNAFIGNRDDNSNGDLISVAFDTYHDYRVAPEFNLNLGGNKTDLTVTDKLSINRSWNAIWEGRTHINRTDSSWTAELRIPFSQLRYNQKNEDGIWGLHVRRIIRRNNEVQNWSIIPIKNNGHVFSFGEMHGMDSLPKPRGIEFLPYTMGKYINQPQIEGSPFQKGHKWEGNIGLDAKFALNDFTLDLTINPDYGQVELDPSVMNLSAYETFYEEKRPFFLEGKHILEFANDNENDMMFYTRRIGSMPSNLPQGIDNQNHFAATPRYIPIIGAVKLTGTNRKGVTIGILESITARTSSRVMRNGVRGKEVTEPLTNYSILRVQKNWEGNTLLGGMLTSVNRDLDEKPLRDRMVENAYTGGIDFTHYFSNRLYYIDAKGMFSALQGNEAAIRNRKMNASHYYQRESAQDYLKADDHSQSLTGTGGYVKAGRKGNSQWNYSQTFSWSSPGFDLNDAGYMKQADYLSNESEVAFRKTDPWGPLRFASIHLTQKNLWDYGGTAVNNDFAVTWKSLSTRHRFETEIKETFNWNTIDSRMLRGGPDLRYNANVESYLTFSTDRAQKVIFKMQYSGRHYSGGGTYYNELRPSMTFRLGNHIHLTGQLNYARNKNDLQYVSTFIASQPLAADALYIMGRMKQQTYGVTLRLQVNITPDISVQYYGSPFTSIARYDRFKRATDTKSHHYDNRFALLSESDINLTDGVYKVNENGNKYSFNDPDFSFNEFRSNLVARWEYLPGSTLYFVWEHNQAGRDDKYRNGWGGNLDRMFGLAPTNTFMVKVNYWFNL